MPRDTLLATLRAATAARHAHAEALVPVLDPSLTLEAYACVLGRFRDAYATLEHTLGGVPAWPAGFDAAARRKLPLLERDLAWLRRRGIVTPVPAAAPATAAAASPDVPTAIGMLYVLEGATLGAQVILRRLGPSLGVSADAGASFYAGYGTETGAMWKAFVAMADNWGEANRDAWDDVVASAQATFDAIIDAFARATA